MKGYCQQCKTMVEAEGNSHTRLEHDNRCDPGENCTGGYCPIPVECGPVACEVGELVEATERLIAETDVECDCVEAWASDVEPRVCAKHAAIEALKPFQKEEK